MRKIITTTFVTLDGVMQAPGGPEEDTSDGFKYGGWMAGGDFSDEITDSIMTGIMKSPFELLLGRKTYDIFAGYWPNAETDSLVAEPFNATKKYVVSHKSFNPLWNNSFCITWDVVSQIKKLKEEKGSDLWVHGSGNLIQTLLKNNLIDRMHLWIFPVTIGEGKKLFASGTIPKSFKLVESKISKPGVIVATYEPKGELKTGSF